jgi:fructose-1,6-bisphosphatase I
LVKRSQLPSSETLGFQGEVNVQGEDQKKLDVLTNNILKRALRFTGRLGVLASEEEDVPVRNVVLCIVIRLEFEKRTFLANPC